MHPNGDHAVEYRLALGITSRPTQLVRYQEGQGSPNIRKSSRQSVDDSGSSSNGKSPSIRVNPISQHFNETMNRIYKPERKLCINEAIVLWHQTELCESNGIVLRVKIYAGKYDDLSGRNHTSNVVLALRDGFLNSGYELYMDNYYNSVGLTIKSTYICGT
uniref:DDE_Tnp_1_7 domain-containing protein n=1 Tax=Glossina austeni TaxID=7395 RepID=A0A1A9VP63_GLOAU